MRKTAKLLIAVLCLAGFGGTALAATREAKMPHRFLPRSLDRDLVQVINPVDGVSWCAWAYRSGAEYDVAVSRLGADGIWSEPLFFGRDDGRNQLQPALAADGDGNLYLAWVDAAVGQIVISLLRPGAESWTAPQPIDGGPTAAAPSLQVVRDRLVVAYRLGGQVVIVHIPLAGGYTESGITDNPDPVGNRPDDGKDKGGGSDDWDWDDDSPTGGNGDGPVPIKR